ncbi:MAG TPA: hypothetical protein RWO09_09905 [Ruminococcus sp.]
MKKYIENFLKNAAEDISEAELCRLSNNFLSDILDEICIVIADKSCDDFMCVEKITEILEKNNFDCGGRHDF